VMRIGIGVRVVVLVVVQIVDDELQNLIVEVVDYEKHFEWYLWLLPEMSCHCSHGGCCCCCCLILVWDERRHEFDWNPRARIDNRHNIDWMD